jgi:hypothetical protein
MEVVVVGAERAPSWDRGANGLGAHYPTPGAHLAVVPEVIAAAIGDDMSVGGSVGA